jgi:radical SAM protein with 4Fe4S-binding SPASM domain
MACTVDNGYYVFENKGEILVYCPNTTRAICLNEIEYIFFQALLSEDNLNNIELFSKTISHESGIPLEVCKTWCEKKAEELRKNILVDNAASLPPLQYKARDVNLVGAYIHLTNSCNLKCSYCYNSEYRIAATKKKAELSYDEIIDLIDQACDMGVSTFTLTGGEPFLNKYCLSIGKYITEVKKCYCEVLTNGTLIENYSINDIFDSFNKIVISLDSHLAELNDMMRGKGTFRKVCETLRVLCSKEEHKVALRPVITRTNVSFLNEFMAFAGELGVKQINPCMYSPRNVNGQMDISLVVSPNDYYSILESQDQILCNTGFTWNFGLNGGCGIGSSIFSLGACGEIFPCQAMHFDELLCGNIRNKSLMEIFNTSPVMKQLRELKPTDIEGCKECGMIPLCGGGCRANAYAIYKNLTAKNEVGCSMEMAKCEFVLRKEIAKSIVSDS